MSLLTGKQRRHLRGLGHHLKPLVLVGQAGVTPAVERKLDRELTCHELVKVRVLPDGPHRAREAGEALAAACGAELVQVLGHTVLLYRPHPEDPVIELPPGRPRGGEG